MLATAIICLVAVFGVHDPVTCFTTETDLDNSEENLDNDIADVSENSIELRTMDEKPNDEGSGVDGIQIIFPGTKWCGTGNVSSPGEEFGIFKSTDKCCKKHDHCTDYIAAGETKNGLHNDAFYTRLQCGCDYEFYDCLKKANTYASNEIGYTYFNAIGTQCYRKDYPIVKCHLYSKNQVKRRCRVYELDMTKAQLWQWFDLPIY